MTAEQPPTEQPPTGHAGTGEAGTGFRVVDAGGRASAGAAPIVPGPGDVIELGPGGRARVSAGEKRWEALIRRVDDHDAAADGRARVEVVVDGWRFELLVEPERRALLRERATSDGGAAGRGGPVELRAIIPGRVVAIDVANGDAVGEGGRLLVVEAMKMQNELRAPRAGTVARLAVGPGQTVERGDLLLAIEGDDARRE